MEIGGYKSIQEHTKFLVFHMQQIFNVSLLEQDCTLHCKDGSTVASSLVLGALSPLLSGYLKETFLRNEDPVILLPEVELGEILLFIKYLFSVKVKKMYSKEDVDVLKKVCDYLSISIDHDLVEPRIQINSESEIGLDPLENDLNNEDIVEKENFEKRSEEEGFPCEYCKISGLFVYFPRKLLLTKHLMTNHAEECRDSNQLLQCDYCGDIFMTKGGLLKHLKNSHKNIESDKILKKIDLNKRKQLNEVKKSRMQCCYCGEEVNFSMLRNHIKKKHPEKEFNCLHCQTQFFNRESLEEHIQEHKGQVALYNACEYCDALFLSNYQLQNHKKTHQIAETYLCKYCEKSFVGRATLEKHEQKHQEGKEYDTQKGRFVSQENLKCDTCDKSFPNKYNLDRHVKSHLGIKSFKCDICGNSFVDSTRLKQHMWIHADYRSFKCEFCDKEFRHKSHMKSHVSSFHPTCVETKAKSFKCNLCDKLFPYQYKLNNHMTWHAAQEQLSSVYVCSICQSAFQSIDTLTEHCETQHEVSNPIQILEEGGVSLLEQSSGSFGLQNNHQKEQVVFKFPDNIHVGDTMHIDEHGFVQVVSNDPNIGLDDLNDEGHVMMEINNQNEINMDKNTSQLSNGVGQHMESDQLVIIKM